MRALIVGAGFYGAVMARTLTDAGWGCLVIERQNHVGGHCHTEFEPEAGCYRHVYGPHIFHTASREIWQYVQLFARFNHFVNRPKVNHRGGLYSFPINLMTLYQVWGVSSPSEAAAALAARRVAIKAPANMEEWCLTTIGQELYEIFIEGYTTKQWGKHPRELPANIVKRLPVRLTFDDNYFTDPYQEIPVGGYTATLAHSRAARRSMTPGISCRCWPGSLARLSQRGAVMRASRPLGSPRKTGPPPVRVLHRG